MVDDRFNLAVWAGQHSVQAKDLTFGKRARLVGPDLKGSIRADSDFVGQFDIIRQKRCCSSPHCPDLAVLEPIAVREALCTKLGAEAGKDCKRESNPDNRVGCIHKRAALESATPARKRNLMI